MGANYTIADWIAGTAILLATLIVPFAIRRWIVRRPLSKTTAGLTAFGIWLGLFSFFWWAASLADQLEAYSRKPHLGILAIAATSYWMLTSAGKDTPKQADYESSSGDSSLGTESRRTPQLDPKRAAAAMRKHRATAPPETVMSKQMNWKPGLLRLWIFVSILWLTGAGSIAILESSPIHQQRISLTEDEQAACEADFSQNNTPPTDAPKPRFGTNDTLVGTQLDTTGLTPLCSARIEYVRDWNLPERNVMSLIISVPLLALGLGMAIAWISSGFRDPNKDATEQSGD